MVYTPEQVKEVKKQIFEQTRNLPDEQRRQIEEQVDRMTPEQLETFVIQQMGGADLSGSRQAGAQKGIFRMIVDGEVPSKVVDENKDSIAVVSKRAVSKGHILIIPKRVVGDVKDLPASVFGMAKKIAKKMVSKLNCKSTEIQSENVFGETVVNIIPVYDRPVGVGSERSEVSDEGMNEIWKLLRVVKKPKVIRIKKKADKQEKVLRLRRRIA